MSRVVHQEMSAVGLQLVDIAGERAHAIQTVVLRSRVGGVDVSHYRRGHVGAFVQFDLYRVRVDGLYRIARRPVVSRNIFTGRASDDVSLRVVKHEQQFVDLVLFGGSVFVSAACSARLVALGAGAVWSASRC